MSTVDIAGIKRAFKWMAVSIAIPIVGIIVCIVLWNTVAMGDKVWEMVMSMLFIAMTCYTWSLVLLWNMMTAMQMHYGLKLGCIVTNIVAGPIGMLASVWVCWKGWMAIRENS